MALELHIVGPGLDVLRVLQPGEPELALGRDADCGVCLPDPQRNVSRRHLAVWNEADELHFRVLSVVNGVEMPFGAVPPGAKGVLASGKALKLAEYNLTVELLLTAPVQEPDPWSVFDPEGSQAASESPAMRVSLASGQLGGMAGSGSPEEDPFGDWGFETTFGPGAAGGGLLDASQLGAAGDLSAFFRGLGLDPAKLGPLSQGELEAIGALVRMSVLGLFELHTASNGVKQDLHAEDRTMVAVKNNNPLKTDWPLETKLRYLFGGRAASVGFVSPDRALRELLRALLTHELAVGAAARAAVEGTVREFSPAALKARLLVGGSKLFESGRAWDAYSKYYSEHAEALPAWAQRLFDKYFTEAYLRESQRIKRETSAGPREPVRGGGG